MGTAAQRLERAMSQINAPDGTTIRHGRDPLLRNSHLAATKCRGEPNHSENWLARATPRATLSRTLGTRESGAKILTQQLAAAFRHATEQPTLQELTQRRATSHRPRAK